MYSIQLDSRRVFRRSALALLGIAMLAACEPDRSFAPTTNRVPSSAPLAKGIKGGGISLVIAILDKSGAPVNAAGSSFTIGKSAQIKMTVTDNGSGDANSAVGRVEVSGVPGGWFDVCQTVAPAGYILPTSCIAANFGGSGPTQMQFTDAVRPHTIWAVIDIISKDTVGGATFTMDKKNGSPVLTIADNSPLDFDPRPGVFEVESDQELTATICLVTPPPSRVLYSGSSACVAATLNAAKILLYDWQVNRPNTIYWTAGTDTGNTVDGTFSITGPNGFAIVVVGNGPYDFAKNEQYYVQVPGAGSYTVCQTVIPAGTQPDENPCRQITVNAGQPSYGGWFYNTSL